MRKFVYGVGIVISSILLAGCGGEEGGDGGIASSGSTAITSAMYLDGSFKSISATEWHFADASKSGVLSYNCSESQMGDRYWKSVPSDNGISIIVIGPSYLPEDDFHWGAAMGNEALKRALSSMNMTAADYLEIKPQVRPQAISSIENAVTNATYDAVTYADILQMAEDFYGATDWARINDADYGLRPTKVAMTKREDENPGSLMQLVRDMEKWQRINEGWTYFDEVHVDYPEELVICLKDSSSMIGWGEGTRYGFDVNAKSVMQRGDDLNIAWHEAIHHLQMIIGSPYSPDHGMERWFAEGQATALSGMDVTTDTTHGRYVLNASHGLTAEQEYGYGNVIEYADYAQTYYWLMKKFGSSTPEEILMHLRYSELDMVDGHDINTTLPAFEDFFVSARALPGQCTYDCGFASLQEWRDDYPNQDKSR